MTLSGCTSAPRSPAPTIIYVGCPTVNSCSLPSSSPAVNGDLSADIRQLETALVACGLQVEAVKQCQEQHHVKTQAATPSLNRLPAAVSD
ncbi:TPA: Rz1-like lysis system protein LysC [Yersinia enterocolitica]|uniref:Rz1-like lysis system protein LysC n=1 Tax=Yersinia enterocolitica TaxID=630 RepID=UPI001E38AEF6|nr:Rz1-like lysis system protein LysC [Yersinia enterocolitica]MCE3066751.1 Rz1-like lysis system protein LysC [Yersinia enterocolitica]MCE3071070.1 Rz1-like lysis system protein LysC [Yersinia enterocolitica]MCE3081336.1 Rz1-like lysis system protein LysC [Yersinia enterocolitica]MCE3102937.1 Rz1-like lysis system protein LysC [Yersinia enterocolitica]MCE3114101.1 Rz1-like lysis system protein LysC [Yersinia enterocolitica]